VTATGFGLVIGFINGLQLVTTNTYSTIPDFHSTSTPHQSSESIPTYLHYPFPGNGSHRNYHRLTLQLLHMNLFFTEAFFTTHAENSTDNCSHGVFFNYEPSTVVSHLELSRTDWSLLLRTPINSWSDMRENALIVASVLTRDVTLYAVTWPFPTLASSKCL
jgi:hypothetical protein